MFHFVALVQYRTRKGDDFVMSTASVLVGDSPQKDPLATVLGLIASEDPEDQLAGIKVGRRLFADSPAFRSALYLAAVHGDGENRAIFDLRAPVRKAALAAFWDDTELPQAGVMALGVNLKHPEAWIRSRVCRSLSAQKKKPYAAWPLLIAQLGDRDPDVRQSVVQALADLHYEEPTTIKALRQSAEAEIAVLSAATAIDPAKAHALSIGWKLDRYLAAVCNAISQLRHRDPDTAAFLLRLIRSDCEEVSAAACAALKGLNVDCYLVHQCAHNPGGFVRDTAQIGAESRNSASTAGDRRTPAIGHDPNAGTAADVGGDEL
jgi:hypothetical protein